MPTRLIASVFGIGLIMALFHHVTADGSIEARATLALGFLLLIAQLGGDLAGRVRLPRITGYLITGFGVGPAWLGLVRGDEVHALQFIADAAVALIAFAAGSELTLESLRAGRAALARVAGATIVLPFAVVSLVVLSVSPWFPITLHQPAGDRIAVALVLGTVAAASSPVVTMALMDELGARGPFARAVLGVTIAKDVAVIVLLAGVLALARPLVSAGALNLAVAWRTLGGLAASCAVGVVLGAVLAQYLRRVQLDTTLVLVAVALLVAELARLGGLEPILVTLAAGFYLANFARVAGERLRAALARGALPVYVVFFALTGAGLHLGALEALWPWVILLVGLRAVALRAGVRWAGRDPRVPVEVTRDGWLGLISQAGVALALAGVARRAFPEWGVSLEALLVAMIGVHEIAGPICFRKALVRVGEVTEGTHGDATLVAREHGVPGGVQR